MITVIRRIDENWAEGKLEDRIGIFPITFVEMNYLAKNIMKNNFRQVSLKVLLLVLYILNIF